MQCDTVKTCVAAESRMTAIKTNIGLAQTVSLGLVYLPQY